MINKRILSVAVTASVLASVTYAQWPGDRPQPQLGVEAGVFIFADSEMRDIFGDAVPKFGISVLGSAPRHRNRFYNNIDLVTANRHGSKLLMVPYTFGYEAAFVKDLTGGTVPYVRVEAGLSYFDYSINREFERVSTKRVGPAAAVEAGLRINDRIQLAGMYRWFGEYDDLNFNGFEISLSYAFARF